MSMNYTAELIYKVSEGFIRKHAAHDLDCFLANFKEPSNGGEWYDDYSFEDFALDVNQDELPDTEYALKDYKFLQETFKNATGLDLEIVYIFSDGLCSSSEVEGPIEWHITNAIQLTPEAKNFKDDIN